MTNWRYNSVLVVFFLVAITIFFKLYCFQIAENDYWRALAQGQHKDFLQLEGDRGEIFVSDKSGNIYPLAVNRSWEYVYLSPREIVSREGDPKEISEKLSEILNIEKERIYERAQRENSSYELIKSRLNPTEVNEIRNLKYPGVHIRDEKIRYYPQNELMSHVVGFLGGDRIGQYGIEGHYNSALEGTQALQERQRIAREFIDGKTFGSIEDGEALVLTIDYNIQFMAEKLLAKARENLNIEGGTVLVGDPNTGKILAMANYPSFNPNEYFTERNFQIFQNPAIQFLFEPGSIFKPITMAVAIEENKMTPSTEYNDTGSVQIGGRTVRNYAQRSYGLVDMTEALEKSINTAAVYAGSIVGNQKFLEYLEKFQFFTKTDIDLQGEVASQNLSFRRGYDINFANAAFGQGIEITPIQLFKSFSALANGGRLVNPYIVERNQEIVLGDKVISTNTSNQITSMMISVTENGFAKTARIPGYYVAGKTGTSQVSWSALGIQKSGYSDKTIQSFIGYAPALNPEFLILVKLDNPQANTAEYSAAPIFGELGRYIVDYYQIPPER